MTKIMPILTLAAGLGLGAWWGEQRAIPLASAGGVPAAAAGTPVTMRLTDRPYAVALPATPDLSVFRAIIREELASALAAKGSARQPVATPAQLPPSPEIVAQRRDAQAQINALIAGGVWGQEQRINFREKLGVLDAGQREEAMKQLFSGINSGAIKIEGPPL